MKKNNRVKSVELRQDVSDFPPMSAKRAQVSNLLLILFKKCVGEINRRFLFQSFIEGLFDFVCFKRDDYFSRTYKQLGSIKCRREKNCEISHGELFKYLC